MFLLLSFESAAAEGCAAPSSEAADDSDAAAIICRKFPAELTVGILTSTLSGADIMVANYFNCLTDAQHAAISSLLFLTVVAAIESDWLSLAAALIDNVVSLNSLTSHTGVNHVVLIRGNSHQPSTS